MIDNYEIQKLRDLPIEGVAERLGIKVFRHKGPCPYHTDKHPSLSFDIKRNRCKCFVCMGENESHDTIDLVMQVLGMGFLEACRWLADENNVILTNESSRNQMSQVSKQVSFDPSRYERFFLNPWLSAEACRFLYDERKLDRRVVNWCRLTSWRDRDGVNWLQIPYYDAGGKLVGVQNRNLDYKKPDGNGKSDKPRFRFPTGSSCSIYNLPIIHRLKPGDDLWVAEGCSDTWSLLSSGKKTLAIPSATLLSTKDKELLTSLSSSLSLHWHMYPDADEPGRKLFSELQTILPDIERLDLPSGCKDYSDYFVRSR